MKSITSGATQAASRETINLVTLTPFADTGAIEMGVRLRSKYFHPTDREMQTSSQLIFIEDREEVSGGKVYLVDRQVGEEVADDPLFEYQIELIMPDGRAYTAENWLSSNNLRLRIGRYQLEQAFGTVPKFEGN